MARKVAASQQSPNPKCEPLPFDACKGLGYSHTQFPNILKHKTSYNAETELNTLLSKLQPKCSLNLIPFLCHLFFPPCPLPQIPVPPCQSLCKSVVEDCSLLGFKDTWSRHVSCEHFPRVDDKEECFLGDKKVAARRTTVIKGSTEKNHNLTETTSLLALKRLQGKHARFSKPVLPMTASVNKIKTKGKGIEKTSSKEVKGTWTKSASPSKRIPPSTISSETRMNEYLTNATQSPEKAQSYSQKASSVTKPVVSSKVSAVTTINTTQSPQKAQSYSQKASSVTKPVVSSKLSAVTTINTTQSPQKAQSYSQKASSVTKPVVSSKLSAVTTINTTQSPQKAQSYSQKASSVTKPVVSSKLSAVTTINTTQSPQKAQSYSQKASSVTKPVVSSKLSAVTTINTTQSPQKAQSYSQKASSVTKPVVSSKLSAVTTINTTQSPQKAQSYSQKAASVTKPVLTSKVSAVTPINDATSLPNLAKEYSTKHVPLSESVQHPTASTDTTMNEQQRNESNHNHGSTSKPLEPSTIQINSTRTTGQPGTESVNENVTTTGFRPENMTTHSRSLFEEGKCGKLLGSSEGQLTSPGYPGEYPPSTTCKWLISLSQDYQEIIFTFHSVFLEEDRNCVYDYIAVYDVLENQVGERYCGSITRPINKHVRGNVAVVIFRSDSTNSKKGFSLSYKASKSRTPPEINT
ncbi:PREDICTED: neurofilament heavy polypeptide-like isoform X2 [Acropora digitifera]|uniref:neurofilament heavy polypeptide-like isoform X2 n=1 Tax=Acropora digitifera TaxID=70779 RepID=UPI00077B0FA0|nr:PREDICTED: neurofilament heavy polypeptide-like isoform X2 [Acropora digitifera]